MLFLAYWYNDKKQIYVSELAKYLPFSAMTISRAVKQLEVTNLFLITKDGVNKVIESKYDKKDLFEGIKQYLSSPIYKSGYIEYLITGMVAFKNWTDGFGEPRTLIR